MNIDCRKTLAVCDHREGGTLEKSCGNLWCYKFNWPDVRGFGPPLKSNDNVVKSKVGEALHADLGNKEIILVP